MPQLRFLLLQIRRADDPIRSQEIQCFADAIDCPADAILPFDLIADRLTADAINGVDAVLIGGSGDYSAAGESEWLDTTLADLRLLYDLRKPTFASCWGFQALARALGGRCIHDPQHAELGTIDLQLTEAGQRDSVFQVVGSQFLGQAGHEDHVVELPPGAIRLASSDAVRNQAFKIDDAPIYCTQFHPELDLPKLIERVSAYPQYVERIVGTTLEEFAQQCRETPESQLLLKRFAELVAAGH